MTTPDTDTAVRERRIKHDDPTITDNEEPWYQRKDFELDWDQHNQEAEEDELYEFPESTNTFLITEKVFSFGFATGIMVQVLSMTCLISAFRNQISVGKHTNALGMAAEVSSEVHITRYIAILIAIINETEVPHALELIGKAFQQKASTKEWISFKRIVFSSFMSLMVGYTFLCSVFLVIVQVTDVLL